MSLILSLLPLFLLSAVLESFTHICLKKASLSCAVESGFRYYIALMKTHFVWMGILSYLIEMLAWLFILSKLPLSIAFPASGMQKIVMVLFAFFVLREPIKKHEGVALILIGSGLVCAFLSVEGLGL